MNDASAAAPQDAPPPGWDERFGGIVRLLGGGAARHLSGARVLVVGIGGVGSWAAEALVRSGIGYLGLVDGDDVCVTNTNRQVHAVAATVGRPKVEVMAERVEAIQPGCTVRAHGVFLGAGNLATILDEGWDAVVDAIDAVPAKCLLLAGCVARSLPVVACGGAGGKDDGTEVRTGDLGHTVNDPLLRQVRKRLRREHGFPSGEGVCFGIAAVYSRQSPVFPWADGTLCDTPEPGSSLRLDCASGFGTAAFVTGAFGLAAAGWVVRTLAKPPGNG